MDNYFQNIFPKISGSQEDNKISIFGCSHSFSGRRGHEDTRILLPCAPHERCATRKVCDLPTWCNEPSPTRTEPLRPTLDDVACPLGGGKKRQTGGRDFCFLQFSLTRMY